MRRRDLIPWLLEQPRTLGQLARELGLSEREVGGEVEHLLASLRHLPYEAEIIPARCRKCDFLFDTKHFRKPSRCPRCHGTWIAEPRIVLHGAEGGGAAAEKAGSREADGAEGAEPEWLDWLDHTADTGFAVRAPDLPTLFCRAAEALFRVLTDPAKVEPRQAVSVHVEAADLPGLLVRWLTELNYRHLVDHLLFRMFEVRIEPGEEPQLDGRAWGEPYDSGRHPLHTEVKAVTWHGLEVEQGPDGWRAQVILDL